MIELQDQVREIVQEIEQTSPRLFWDILKNRPSAELNNRIEKFITDMTDTIHIFPNEEQREAEQNKLTDQLATELCWMAGYRDSTIQL